MRDPIQRAWSEAKHNFLYREGVFASFEGSFATVPDEMFIRHFTGLYNVAIGDYLACLKRGCGVLTAIGSSWDSSSPSRRQPAGCSIKFFSTSG